MLNFLGFLFPEQASTIAPQVDELFHALVAITLFFSLLICSLIVFFAVKYRRKVSKVVGTEYENRYLELIWSVLPLLIGLAIFAWSVKLYLKMSIPPKDAMVITVVGKQWMWKFQHPDGRREINELHVPMGYPIKLMMISQDVIHSLYVPAFRVKNDVLPGRYSSIWFEATKPGKYHLFCTEYCGTKHSEMIGSVIVMEPVAFQQWLAKAPSESSPTSDGKKLMAELGCVTCHRADSIASAPRLEGIYGSKVKLDDGKLIPVTEDYLRESILRPSSQVVAGYQPVMPAYQGRVSEDELLQLIAYIKSTGEKQ